MSAPRPPSVGAAPGSIARVPRPAIWWLLATAALAAAFALDRTAFHAMLLGKDAVEGGIFYELARGLGTLWAWLGVAVVGALLRRGSWRARVRTGLWIFLAAALSGLAAEILKSVVGRERPILHDGQNVLRALRDRLNGANLSFPSSHTAVAFGGASMVLRLARGRGVAWRTGAGLLLLVAAACGVSRMLTGAHFLSDVVGAAMLGCAVSGAVRRLFPARLARRHPGVLLWRPHARSRRSTGSALPPADPP